MKNKFIPLNNLEQAANIISEAIPVSPLDFSSKRLKLTHNNIYFKREDLQTVRSYKIRGAYFMIKDLMNRQDISSIITASAGNHAQGVAWACHQLEIHCTIVVPNSTPMQKISRIKYFGQSFVHIIYHGSNFNEALDYALSICQTKDSIFIPPYNHKSIISGQASVALEIVEQLKDKGGIDYLLVPVGGGGLLAGCINVLKQISAGTKIIAVESKGAAKLSHALKYGAKAKLASIDNFADGTALNQIGAIPFSYIKDNIDDVIVVDEGLISQVMIELYQNDGIITEPSGAMSIAALEDLIKKYPKIKNKNIVCIISGGNNDISRYGEIIERTLIYKKLKHYFILELPQKPGQLKIFINKVLGANDDIVFFKYIKKSNRETGRVLIGTEHGHEAHYHKMIDNMIHMGLSFKDITDDYIKGNIIL